MIGLGVVVAALAVASTIGAGIAVAVQLGGAEPTTAGAGGSASPPDQPAGRDCAEEVASEAEAAPCKDEGEGESEGAEGDEAETEEPPEEADHGEGEDGAADQNAAGLEVGATIKASEAEQAREGEPTSMAGGVGPSADRPARDERRGAGSDGGSEASSGGSSYQSETDTGSLGSLSIGSGASSLESLDVPAALLPVYQACGTEYGISWEVLAAINKVETNFGSNLGPSSAGAEGWMQFLPSSWEEWGVDGNGDGRAQTDDPVDAICSAARYLAASGGEEDIYDAVLAYNHADWYAREVLGYAREYERVPANLVNSLTALAESSTSPVAGRVSYWNRTNADELLSSGSLSEEKSAIDGREMATISSRPGAQVRAVVDATVVKTGRAAGFGRYVVLRDAYGDRFVYSGLDKIVAREGEKLAAAETLGRAGEGAVGFSVKPGGSDAIDPTELLEIWEDGGVSGVYDVKAGGSRQSRSAATTVLLMSSGQLGKRVLADGSLDLPRCVRSAVRGGELRRQALASLEYLTSRGFDIGVSASTCKRRSGFAIEIAKVDGTAVKGNQERGGSARSLVRTALAMDGSLAPQRVVSASGLQGSEAGDAKTIELDYFPPQKARVVDGKAIAPTGAPAAVQEMIAAANQISDEPYVWGGGHGSWVSDGYDCSGSVSYVLHAAEMLSTPLTSGALESWGESGSGRWVTIYANSEHTYAVIAGLRWDTVGDLSGSGPRWHTGDAYPAGFTVRHPQGY